jgi:hypothetical protein
MSQESGSEAVNPYASPQSFPAMVGSPTAPSSPAYQLYSVRAIVLATFLGSLFAGGLLMAIDYRRLDKIGTARLCLAIATVSQLLLFGLVFLMPDNVPTMLVLLPQLAVMYVIAEQGLGSALRRHEKAGGKQASLWKAAGIGLACCVLYLVVLFVGAFILAITGLISFDE